MARIVYVIFSSGGLQGGHKTILRHVETLRDLGFDAVAYTGVNNKLPWWFEHRAPILVAEPLSPDNDVLVLPDDAPKTLEQMASRPYRTVLMVQAHLNTAANSLGLFDLYRRDPAPTVMSVSPAARALLTRLYPDWRHVTVRAFADERVFRPGAARQDAVTLIPRKRAFEAKVIASLFPRLYPAHAGLPWRPLENVTERELAGAMGSSSLFLSLSRLESLGMTPLEAMASGCVVAGFTGIGGRAFATPDNGFWVDEDDCPAAAEALAQAADLVAAGGPALRRRLDAGYETARQWSHAAFRDELEQVWMQIAPDARISDKPLDA